MSQGWSIYLPKVIESGQGCVDEVPIYKNQATELKRPHYYDNSLIFRVTKEQASIKTTWDRSGSSSTSSHMDRTNCVLRQPFSPIHRGLVEVL